MLVSAAKANMEGLGYQIVAETNTLRPLERFKAQPDTFDLLISDKALPGISGDRLQKRYLYVPKFPFSSLWMPEH
jgi:CheY-like chemotaxis protein